jgi:DNA-binding NarL/FixJ family response regulator
MPAVAVSGDPVIVVDSMEFRRALVASFLKDWAAAEKVELLSSSPSHAHQALREGTSYRMIIYNAGVALCAGTETLAEIKVLRALAPSASLVVVADDEASEHIVAVVQSGAEGYLSNRSTPDLVLHALSFVLQGGTYFPRSALAHAPVADEDAIGTNSENHAAAIGASAGGEALVPAVMLPDLSDRQLAILQGLCRGEPNKTIGRALNLPESTVKVHVREIMRKLAVSNRTQVAVIVSRMNAALLHEPGVGHAARDSSRSEDAGETSDGCARHRSARRGRRGRERSSPPGTGRYQRARLEHLGSD